MEKSTKLERASKIYLSKTREEDIKIRGENHLVFDHDGHIVKLKNAKVWYCKYGNYVEPHTSENIGCIGCIVM